MVVVAAAASSLQFFFDFDFLVFFGHTAISVAAGISLRCGARKLNARRRASLRPCGGPSRANRGETLGDPVCVNSDEFWRAPWGRRKAVLPGVLGFEHLVDPFSIGRVANVARRQGDVIVDANPESPRESRFSLSVCGLVDVFVEFNAEWKSGAGIVVAVGYGSGTSGIELNSSISSASEIRPNPSCHAASRVLLGSPYHTSQS